MFGNTDVTTMATIKSFSDLNQSKVLAKILPPETADMCIGNYVGKSGEVDETNIHYYPKGESFGAPEIINAWSLAALLDILPKVINNETLYIETSPTLWHIGYRDAYTVRANNLFDACYELILELHEMNLL